MKVTLKMTSWAKRGIYQVTWSNHPLKGENPYETFQGTTMHSSLNYPSQWGVSYLTGSSFPLGGGSAC